jgi:hypothetical protein
MVETSHDMHTLRSVIVLMLSLTVSSVSWAADGAKPADGYRYIRALNRSNLGTKISRLLSHLGKRHFEVSATDRRNLDVIASHAHDGRLRASPELHIVIQTMEVAKGDRPGQAALLVSALGKVRVLHNGYRRDESVRRADVASLSKDQVSEALQQVADRIRAKDPVGIIKTNHGSGGAL